MVTTAEVDSMRDAWLDPEDEPSPLENDSWLEPTDEELEEQVNDHVLRAWDYLVDNSEAIDNVLRQLIADRLTLIHTNDMLSIAGLLQAAVDATKDGPPNHTPSMYVLLKAAKFLIESQLVKGNLSIGMTEQMTDWLQDANRYFTNTK